MFEKLNIKRGDIALIASIFLFAILMNLYQEPYIAALVVALAIVTIRVLETIGRKPKDNRTEDESVVIPPHKGKAIPAPEANMPVEQRTVQEIINNKLNNGAIEKAVEEQFDAMVENTINDLFGNFGDVSREIKTKLRESMNSYIERHDFSQHNVKLEHLMNQLIHSVTKDQDRIIKNVGEILGVEPIKEIKASELFDKYTEHIGKNIETDNLEIDYESDGPSYQNITASLTAENGRTSHHCDEKILTFTCEEDEELNVIVKLRRWKDSLLGNDWHIASVSRSAELDAVTYTFKGEDDITSLDLPFKNLRSLNELEVFLLKLHYDRTAIELDETDIYDEDVEVDAEPEVHFS